MAEKTKGKFSLLKIHPLVNWMDKNLMHRGQARSLCCSQTPQKAKTVLSAA